MPEDVEAEPDALTKIRNKAKEYLRLSSGQKLDILAVGRAYLPQTASNLPIICQAKIMSQEAMTKASSCCLTHTPIILVLLAESSSTLVNISMGLLLGQEVVR